MKIAIITLGCKVNSYESDSLRLALKNMGHEVYDNFEPADIYIINTCAVTNEAERKSRQMVSKCRKLNPNAKIICDEQRLRPEKSEVNRLLGCNEKIMRLTDWKPQYSLEQGLQHTIHFLKENLDKYKIDLYNI